MGWHLKKRLSFFIDGDEGTVHLPASLFKYIQRHQDGGYGFSIQVNNKEGTEFIWMTADLPPSRSTRIGNNWIHHNVFEKDIE